MRKLSIILFLSVLFTLNVFSEIPESKFKNKDLLEQTNYSMDFSPMEYFPDNLSKECIHDFALMLDCKADLVSIRKAYDTGSYQNLWMKDYTISEQFNRYIENLYWKTSVYINNELKQCQDFYHALPNKAKELLVKYKGTSLELILTIENDNVSFLPTNKVEVSDMVIWEMKYPDLKQRAKNKDEFQYMIEPSVTYYTLYACYPDALKLLNELIEWNVWFQTRVDAGLLRKN